MKKKIKAHEKTQTRLHSDSDHPLITRRQFLAQGLIAGTGTVLGPSLLGLMAERAFGQTSSCSLGASSGRIPFIALDLAGGSNIAGSNFMVGGPGGQLDFLASYEGIGLRAGANPQVRGTNNAFGIHMHADSAFLAGMLATTTPEVQAKMDGIVMPCESGDDTSGNPFNANQWAAKSGSLGSLAKIVGTNATPSGGNSVVPSESFSLSSRSTRVNRAQDARGLVDLGFLAQELSQEKAQAITRAAGRMSDSQLQRFNALDLPVQVRELASCAYLNAPNLAIQFAPDVLDPRLDPSVVANFGVNNNQFPDGNTERAAAIAKLVLDGYAGSGTLTIGGADYHNNARTNTDTFDFNAGRFVGRMFSLAAAKNKPLMLYIFTDGAVGSDGSADPVGRFDANGTPDPNNIVDKSRFTSDAGEKGCAVLLVFNPNATRAQSPLVNFEGRQIGAFKSVNGRQAADRSSSLLGNNVVNVVKAVMLNYLALHGEEGRLAEVVGDNPFSSNLSKYLLFNRIA